MTYLPIEKIISESWIGRLFVRFNHWWISSFVVRLFDLIFRWIQSTFQQSCLYRYLTTNQLFLSKIMRRSRLMQYFIKSVWILVAWIMNIVRRVFSASMTDRLLISIRRDIRLNPVRYISSFGFSALVFWSVFTLLLGSGFSKLEMTGILLLAFLLWFLSYIDINSAKALADSRIWQWFLSWAEAHDQPNGSKTHG